jgi:ATP-binding cassette subfamily B protein
MFKQYPLLRCLAIYRQMPWSFSLSFLLFTTINILLALQQWLIGHAINDVNSVHHHQGIFDPTLVLSWLWFIIGVAVLRCVLQYFSGILSMSLSQELLGILRMRILDQVQNLHLGYHWQHGVGEMITRTTRDADKVRDALISFWRQIVETPLVMTAAVGLLCWYHPLLGIVPLILTLIGLFIFVRQTAGLVSLDREVGAAYDKVNQDLSEGISGVRAIKAFALEEKRIRRFDQQVLFFAEKSRAALLFASTRIPLPQVVVAFSHVWIMVYGAYLVESGQIGIGELVTSLLIATTLIFRVEDIGRVMQVFADARSSANRIWQLLDATPEIISGTQAIPPAPLGIRLRNVAMKAPKGERYIIEHLNFDIQPGNIVAMVGATGSGKSLIASLLPRLNDLAEGEVLVGADQTRWVNVKEADLQTLRKRIHVVPQESFLFSGTLADNLRISSPDATDDELLWAIDMASATDVLHRLPNGLDTPLGDRGVTLSGGQRQRISLARAFLANPDILCLDDATSALDALSEQRIVNNIRKLNREGKKTISVLVISSRLSTILLADHVLLLDKGHISDQGTHEDLRHRNHHYCDLLGISYE